MLFHRLVGAGSNKFNPASLFSNGEPGVWYDPSDLTSLWTDTSRTTQATVNDAIACMDDKSGNGNHAIQSTSAYRPILRQSGDVYYLEFDGSNDFFEIAVGTIWSNTDGLFAALGNDKEIYNSTSRIGFPASLNQYNSGVSGRYWALGDVFSGTTINGSYGFYVSESRTSFNRNAIAPVSQPSNGTARILSGWWSPSGAANARVNLGTTGTASASVTNIDSNSTSTPLRIGIYKTSPDVYTDAKFYGALVVGDSKTSTERENVVTYIAEKAGITL